MLSAQHKRAVDTSKRCLDTFHDQKRYGHVNYIRPGALRFSSTCPSPVRDESSIARDTSGPRRFTANALKIVSLLYDTTACSFGERRRDERGTRETGRARESKKIKTDSTTLGFQPERFHGVRNQASCYVDNRFAKYGSVLCVMHANTSHICVAYDAGPEDRAK